jgi:hypothetical protein
MSPCRNQEASSPDRCARSTMRPRSGFNSLIYQVRGMLCKQYLEKLERITKSTGSESKY